MKIYLFVISLISLAGCSSTSNRTTDDQAYVKSLSEAEQADIANGDPKVGDSVRGLLIAFGKPAFSTQTPEGTEFLYLSVTSKRYPGETVSDPPHTWDNTTDFHILIRDGKIVRFEAENHGEEHYRGVAIDPPHPRVPGTHGLR